MSIYGEPDGEVGLSAPMNGNGATTGPAKLNTGALLAKVQENKIPLLVGFNIFFLFVMAVDNIAGDDDAGAAGLNGPPGPPGPTGGTTHFSHCDVHLWGRGNQGLPNFMLDNVQCDTGHEGSISECNYETETHNCGAYEGVWVSCASSSCNAPPPPPAPPKPTINQIRLVDTVHGYVSTDGITPTPGGTPGWGAGVTLNGIQQGMLQAQTDGQWGYVCDDYGFSGNDNAASVACKQLGFDSGVACDPPAALTDQQCGVVAGGVTQGMMCSQYTLDNVRCSTPDLHSLGACSFVGEAEANCWASEAVHLVCAQAGHTATCPPPPPARIRLNPMTNGIYDPSATIMGNPNAGILESSTDNGGTWHPVCDDRFDRDNNAVAVVCQQLGLFTSSATTSHCDANVGTYDFGIDDLSCPDTCTIGSVTNHANHVECNTAAQAAGTIPQWTSGALHNNIQQCQYSTIYENCGPAEGVWVQCAAAESDCDTHDTPPPPPPRIDQIRLVSAGDLSHSIAPRDITTTGGGILQAYVDGQWGFVCDDKFDADNNAAEVACRQLGFTGGVHCDTEIPCPDWRDSIHTGEWCKYTLDDVMCTSNTFATLSQCSSIGYEHHNCGHSEGIYLSCGPNAQCPPKPAIQGIRLVRGTRSSGILQASTDGRTWGPVCDDRFDRNDKQVEVVCRQLGFLDADGEQTGQGRRVWRAPTWGSGS